MTDHATLRDLLARVKAATEWRAVPGWPYEASDNGLLRQARTHRVIRPTVNQAGYEHCTFVLLSARKDMKAHRAVALAWLGQCPDGMQVNHIDGNKRNNSPANLEYVTPSENMRHASRLGLTATGLRNGTNTRPELRRRGTQMSASKLTEADVLTIRSDRAAGISLGILAARFGVSKTLIKDIGKRRAWTHI